MAEIPISSQASEVENHALGLETQIKRAEAGAFKCNADTIARMKERHECSVAAGKTLRFVEKHRNAFLEVAAKYARETIG
jgi:hypothetical protein